jgi:16S rRNA (adenine1518-N6/adenine1519-N6)-dimethyltransferase
VGPESHVLEIGAGLGSLTLPLARTGASVVAVEVDRSLVPAVEEVVSGFPRVSVVAADAMTADWGRLLGGPGPWTVAANLPYNVSVPVVLRLLVEEPRVGRMVVMVQREVGRRLAAAPGEEDFGAVSLKVAYRAEARVVRPVSRSVFWPVPNVDSVLVSLDRLGRPPVEVDEDDLWRVVTVAFGQRRKTMRNALVRLGLDAAGAVDVLASCGVDAAARPEVLGLEEFACLARAWRARRGSRLGSGG